MAFIEVSFAVDFSKSSGLLEYLKVPEALLFLVNVESESRLKIFAPSSFVAHP